MKSKIYAYKFFSDFVIIYPLYAVMFSDFGMDPWRIRIAVLLAVWSATAFALEVPSGVWADRYARKNILFLRQVVRAAAFAVSFIAQVGDFRYGFIIMGLVMIAVGTSYLHLSAKKRGQPKQVQRGV